MPRVGMAAIIARLRGLIHDPAGASPHFTDDELQDTLDQHRLDVQNGVLTPTPTYASNGSVLYLDAFAGSWAGMWEASPILQGYDWAVLAPATSDLATGHWTFATDTQVVYITGKVYDLFGAAAEALEMWAAALALEYDVTADGSTLNRSQKREALLQLAQVYAKRSTGSSRARFVRDDSL